MEVQHIVEALRATTSAENQKEASNYLEEKSKIIGFAALLMQLATNPEMEANVRQAAIIYLKNVIHKSWVVEGDEKDTVMPLSDQDKSPIRQAIIGAIVHSPEAIRIHLCSCVQFIMKHDYPDKWPTLLDELVHLLHTSDGSNWLGALLVIHKLAKVYE
jgi:hypothetical protein